MILVTGISGVGKTHTLERFVRLHPAFVRIGASALLNLLGLRTSSMDAGTAEQNQHFLAAMLAQLGRQDFGRTLVDGHAAIETSDGVYLVPDAVVIALSPRAIVTIVEDDHATLLHRHVSKGGRPEVGVQDLQHLEVSRSMAWSSLVGVPFRQVRSGDTDGLAVALTSSGVVL